MKKYVAKTVDEAIALALVDYPSENADSLMYEVTLEKKSLFGKKAEIEVYDLSDVIDFALNYLTQAISNYEIEVKGTATIQDDIIHLALDTNHNSILIGKNGRTLQALNELTKLAVSSKFKKRFRILLDIGEYKDDKYDKLVHIARHIAREVQKSKVTATLDPMPADERRMIHNALHGMPHIATESIGEGKRRQITIRYVEEK